MTAASGAPGEDPGDPGGDPADTGDPADPGEELSYLSPSESEAESRPHPDPEHSLSVRKPRTVGGVVYLAVLAATLTGVVMVALDEWRTGLATIGVAVVVGGLSRLALPDRSAGMLHIRRKLVDVTTLLVLGGGLVVLSVVIPDGPTAP